MRRMAVLFLAVSISSPALAYVAPFEGIEMQTIVVDSVEYEVPVGNRDRKQDIYYLKKALKGDSEAREMFLGGADEKMFFIGQENPLWLKVTMDSMEVVKP